jgi:threonine dehydrogenase-like Zn-dependent dehydrogenase
LKLAASYGARYAINTTREDAKKRIEEITGGRMAEAVMEISGASQAVVDTYGYASNAGRIILTGWAKAPVELDTRIIMRKEIDLLGQRNTDRAEIAKALGMIYSHEVNVMGLVTKTVDFSDMARTVAHMAEHPDENVKVMTVLGNISGAR